MEKFFLFCVLIFLRFAINTHPTTSDWINLILLCAGDRIIQNWYSGSEGVDFMIIRQGGDSKIKLLKKFFFNVAFGINRENSDNWHKIETKIRKTNEVANFLIIIFNGEQILWWSMSKIDCFCQK